VGMPPIPGLGGGAPGGAAPQPSLATALAALQGKTASPGKELSQQTAELQGADPQLIQRKIDEIYDVMGVIFTKTFQTLPNVANQIAQAMKAWSRVQKEIQQASNVSQVVGKSEEGMGPQPISFGPAQAGQQGPNPAT
jgi:hypothetical protein